ncbi:hypothetical protein TNCV_2019231 [Trichonephila clavipes]|nr:hypothetical protein TNCV_2019231 [Trichonephila clavipes]
MTLIADLLQGTSNPIALLTAHVTVDLLCQISIIEKWERVMISHSLPQWSCQGKTSSGHSLWEQYYALENVLRGDTVTLSSDGRDCEVVDYL